MKVSPMAQADGGNPQRTLTPTSTTNGEVAARARAIARGEAAPTINVTSADPALDAAVEAELLKGKAKALKMRTNFTPKPVEGAPVDPSAPTPAVDHHTLTTDAPAAPTTPENTPQPTPEVPIRSTDEKATPAAEDTKPLSPQYAALARQKRALQVKERELATREQALAKAAAAPQAETADALRARLKTQALSVLLEEGVTYDQLTEQILSQGNNPEIYKLKEELKALKEGFDKSLSERDARAEEQALSEMQREAQRLASREDFELVRETGSVPEVMDLIKRTWKETGEVLDVPEAMRLVEEDLVDQTLKVAALNKVKTRLAPKPAPAAPVAQAPKAAAQPAAMRTLTNRDTSAAPLSRKERAMQAFWKQK